MSTRKTIPVSFSDGAEPRPDEEWNDFRLREVVVTCHGPGAQWLYMRLRYRRGPDGVEALTAAEARALSAALVAAADDIDSVDTTARRGLAEEIRVALPPEVAENVTIQVDAYRDGRTA